MKFYQTTLSNGLTVIAELRASAPSTAIGFFVRAGARDESPEISGVSHFLEHMMFKGTKKRDALQVTYDMAAIGAQANAFTSEENTVYYMHVLPEYLDDAAEILSDMLRPALDSAEFDTEKKVILEEIALYKDRPTHVLFESSVREYFSGHAAGNSVLGSTESVSGISVEQMRSYFDSRYSPANMVFAVTGNTTWEHVLELAEKHCSGWKGEAVGRERLPHNPVSSSKVMHRENLQMAHACLLTRAPSQESELRYSADVLTCILGDGSGSKTFWALIDKGLADSAYIDYEEMDHAGFVYGYVSAEPSRIEMVRDMLGKIMSEPLSFTEDDLTRAKTKIRTRLVLQGESTMRRLTAVGLEWIARGEYSPLEQELSRLAGVQRREIESLVSDYTFAPVTSVTMLPQA